MSDFFVAKQSDATAVAKARWPAKKWPNFFAKDLDGAKLNHLWLALHRGRKEPLPEMRLLHSSAEEDCWVYVVPRELVELAAAIDDPALAKVAAAWATAKVFKLDGWRPEDVEEALGDLRGLCQKARESRRSLLLRIGL